MGNQARMERWNLVARGDSGGSSMWGDGLTEDQPGHGEPIVVSCTRIRPDDATAELCVELAADAPITDATKYLKVSVDGALWIDLSSLSSSDRKTVVEGVRGMQGAPFIDPFSGNLWLGPPVQTTPASVDTRTPESVLADANGRGDEWAATPAWQFLNGGEAALQAGDADASGHVPGQTKPGAWYNSYAIDGTGKVVSHTSRYDPRKGDAPELDPDGLKALIMTCMDAGGLRSAMEGDEARFRQAMTARFGSSHFLGRAGLEALLAEVWSYLTTGAGTDGAVDIGRLQSIMRAMSGDSSVTAETNTHFEGTPFMLGDVGLARGDGQLGRATMLSMMHLTGTSETSASQVELALEETEQTTDDFVPSDGFGDQDFFVVDRSGSMMNWKWPRVEGAVDQAMDWQGRDRVDTRTVGHIHSSSLSVGRRSTMDVADALGRAYAVLHPDNTVEDQAAFAALFGLQPSTVFIDGSLDGAELMKQIGDRGSTEFGAHGESGLKSMLMVLTHPELLPRKHALRVALEGGSGTPGVGTPRLNAVVDEPEQCPEYLSLVQSLADALGVDARFIAVPTALPRNEDCLDHLVFIDLDHVTTNAAGQATVRYTHGGRTAEKTIEMTRFGSFPQTPFRNARIPLHDLHEVVGVTD